MTWAFIEAERLREKRRIEFTNAQCHLMGMYVYEAICDVSPILHAFAKKGTKAKTYRARPYPLSKNDKEMTEEEKAKKQQSELQKARAYMLQMDMVGRHWKKQ